MKNGIERVKFMPFWSNELGTMSLDDEFSPLDFTFVFVDVVILTRQSLTFFRIKVSGFKFLIT